MRSCSQIFLSTITCAMAYNVYYATYAIVYICTYYDSANRTQNIYCRHCSELLLPRCINVTIRDTKHSLIPLVCVLSDIFTLISIRFRRFPVSQEIWPPPKYGPPRAKYPRKYDPPGAIFPRKFGPPFRKFGPPLQTRMLNYFVRAMHCKCINFVTIIYYSTYVEVDCEILKVTFYQER